jgi:hypothetical protein
MGYNSRLRSGGNSNLSPNVASRQYGTQGNAAQMVRLPPADLLRQTDSGATLRTLRGSPGLNRGPVSANSAATALAYAEGGDSLAALTREIAQRAEGAFVKTLDEMRYPPNFASIPLNIGLVNQLVLEKATAKRVYLFVTNTHPTNNLFITVGQQSTALLGVPIVANNGFFEWLFVVPQGDIHLIANGANTTGVLLYAELSPSNEFRPSGY